MIRLQNSVRRYGAVAMTLHWLMALLLLGLVLLGLYMVGLPDAGFDKKKVMLVLYHKELGILALLLVVPRLLWRAINPLPRLVEALPDWQKVVARFVHLCFYGLMFALPVTGWLMSSAAGIPVSFLGLLTLPDAVSHDDPLFRTFIEIHKWLGYALILFMLAHIGAALRHHFLFKDETLRKMLPAVRSE
jgi:cytochrome b561